MEPTTATAPFWGQDLRMAVKDHHLRKKIAEDLEGETGLKKVMFMAHTRPHVDSPKGYRIVVTGNTATIHFYKSDMN